MPKFLATLMAVTLMGCHSLGLDMGAGPQTRFYAAVADYNSAKEFAAVYVHLSTTSLETSEKILSIIVAADAVISQTYVVLYSGKASAAALDRSVETIKQAQATLVGLTTIPGAKRYFPLYEANHYQRTLTLRERTNYEHRRHNETHRDGARHGFASGLPDSD